MTQPGRHPRLVADLGGTNLRLAVQREENAPLSHVATFACGQHRGLLDAIRSYLNAERLPAPKEAAIGVAAPIRGDDVRLINNPTWNFSINGLRTELGLSRLEVLNDFAALAHGVPALKESDLQAVGATTGQAAEARATRIVVGPGTGLGLAAISMDPQGRPHIISGEGGHSTLPAADEREAELLRRLRSEFGHVSAERVVSGGGLVNLYRAHCAVSALTPQPLDAAGIVERARAGDDAICSEVVKCFVGFLGSFAGNQALAFGALGGVYLGGGVLSHLGPLFDARWFRERFEAKGRYEAYLRAIPTWLIVAETPALSGALAALG